MRVLSAVQIEEKGAGVKVYVQRPPVSRGCSASTTLTKSTSCLVHHKGKAKSDWYVDSKYDCPLHGLEQPLQVIGGSHEPVSQSVTTL